MLFMAFDNAFFFEFADLDRKTATLNFKIVGKLLAIVGNLKAVTVFLFGFLRKIGQKLVTCAALGDHLDLLVKTDGFVG